MTHNGSYALRPNQTKSYIFNICKKKDLALYDP